MFHVKDNFQCQYVLASTDFMTKHLVKFTNSEISMYTTLKELIIYEEC